MFRRTAVLLIALLLVDLAHAAAPPLPQSKAFQAQSRWLLPVQPVQIADHTWYIGSAGLAALLIKTDAGAIVIDGGMPQAAPMLLANLRRLGVQPHSVRYLLHSHAHADHAGALAALKRETGALLISNAESAWLLARGGSDDLHFGDDILFPPVQVDRLVHDGEVLSLDSAQLTVRFIPGHTPGSMAWTWSDTRDRRPVRIAYVDSLSFPGYRLVGHPRLPRIAEDYRRSFDVVRTLPCDLLLVPHPEAGDWDPASGRAPRLRPDACRHYADAASAKFEKAFTEQRQAQSVAKGGH